MAAPGVDKSDEEITFEAKIAPASATDAIRKFISLGSLTVVQCATTTDSDVSRNVAISSSMSHIDSCAVGKIRAAFAAKRHQHIKAAITGASITVSGAIEIAAWLADSSHNDQLGRTMLEALDHPAVNTARELFGRGTASSITVTGAGEIELATVSELTSSDKRWAEYLMRFSGALQRAGYSTTYAEALSYSFHEMADNVRQHAAQNPNNPPKAVAGWHVVEGIAAFSVVDLGRGVRASLTTNPNWSQLATDREALLATVRDQATRKAGNKFGDGYREVVRNFVSRNGCLALRSGESELVATGSVLDGAIRTTPLPSFKGTRVTAWCAPHRTALPKEPAT